MTEIFYRNTTVWDDSWPKKEFLIFSYHHYSELIEIQIKSFHRSLLIFVWNQRKINVRRKSSACIECIILYSSRFFNVFFSYLLFFYYKRTGGNRPWRCRQRNVCIDVTLWHSVESKMHVLRIPVSFEMPLTRVNNVQSQQIWTPSKILSLFLFIWYLAVFSYCLFKRELARKMEQN
jgi:hypothetical protein